MTMTTATDNVSHFDGLFDHFESFASFSFNGFNENTGRLGETQLVQAVFSLLRDFFLLL